MKSIKSLFAASAIALAIAAPAAHAGIGDVYQSGVFNGVTFTFTQTSATDLTFNIAGALTSSQTAGSTWFGAQYLGAFDLKDLGINFGTYNGFATGPGASNLAGLNTQLSAASQDCLAAGSPPGSVCWDINPNVALTNSMTYLLHFNTNLAINNSVGPHLQIAFTQCALNSCAKVGSLYSQNIIRSSTSSGVPEPGTSALALLGLGLVGTSLVVSRKRHG